MAKKCIFCKKPLDESDVFDVCHLCGYKVWGPKMYDSIVENMQQAKEDGDLFQGSVFETQHSKAKEKTQFKPSFEQSKTSQPEIEILPIDTDTSSFKDL